MPSSAGRRWSVSIAAVGAVLFGLLTIREGGSVLLGEEHAVSEAGDYVPFVLWFNTFAGFAYVAAGAGLWWQKRWAAGLALVIAVSSMVVLAALLLHVVTREAYELRTVVAMTLRTAIWVAISAVAYRHIWRPGNTTP
jgi:hypothetical protein